MQTVARAITVLNTFSFDEPELGVSEISRRLGLSRTTVSRILTTLAKGGLVEKVPGSRKYRLGAGTLLLASKTFAFLDLRQAASDVVTALAKECRETVAFSTMRDEQVVTLDVALGSYSLRTVSWIGRLLPLHCTSSGKLLLAFAPESTQHKVLASVLERHTENTITDPEKLRRELMEIRERQYAMVFQELETGLNAISVPVFDRSAQVIGAISVSGPSARLDQDKLLQLEKLARVSADKISTRLGYLKTQFHLKSAQAP